jgi:hypothetical protein
MTLLVSLLAVERQVIPGPGLGFLNVVSYLQQGPGRLFALLPPRLALC